MTAPSYQTHDPRGWGGDPKRGAALGRPTYQGPPDFSGRITLRKIRLDSGGYDVNGTYWGGSATESVYWYASDDSAIDGTLWASDRAEAREKVLEWYPKASVRR